MTEYEKSFERFASVLTSPFGYDVDGAFLVPQHDRAQVDGLDQAALAVDDRDVADAHLILENQKEPGNHVAHERLRAEADRQAENAGAGQRPASCRRRARAAPSGWRCTATPR